MDQLFGRDLRNGDVLLEVCGDAAVHRIIRFGQKLMHRGTEDVIHAGIMFDNRYMIESEKHGIWANDIYLQNKPYGFLVFRPRDKALAAGAATCAKVFLDMNTRTGAMPYSVKGAIASIFKKAGAAPTTDQMESAFDQLIKGKNHPFFCSQFVVFVFQFVAEQNKLAASKMFPFKDAAVPPSLLATTLKTHPMFEEAGYLIANER